MSSNLPSIEAIVRTHRAPSAWRGSAYCPRPTRRTQRAYDTGRVYSRPLIALIVVAVLGGAWMLASGAHALLLHAVAERLGSTGMAR